MIKIQPFFDRHAVIRAGNGLCGILSFYIQDCPPKLWTADDANNDVAALRVNDRWKRVFRNLCGDFHARGGFGVCGRMDAC